MKKQDKQQPEEIRGAAFLDRMTKAFLKNKDVEAMRAQTEFGAVEFRREVKLRERSFAIGFSEEPEETYDEDGAECLKNKKSRGKLWK